MRALIVTGLSVLAVPLAFISPVLGLVAYCLLATTSPGEMLRGFGPVSLGLGVAVAMVVGMLIREGRSALRKSPVLFTLLGLWGWWGVASLAATDRALAFESFAQISTVVLVAVAMIGLCTDRKRLRWVVAALAGGLALQAVRMALVAVARGGAVADFGLGGMLANSAATAAAFGMALPFCAQLALGEKRPWPRLAWWIGTAGLALAVTLSYSRAGVVGMLAAGVVMVWQSRIRTVSLLLVAPVLLASFLAFAPSAHVAPVDGSGAVDIADVSPMRGVKGWRNAVWVASENPLTGVGPGGLQARLDAVPQAFDMPRLEVHSNYLELAASGGVPLLLLFLAMFGLAVRSAAGVLRDAEQRRDERLTWFVGMSRATLAALVASAAAGTFAGLLSLDLVYLTCALAACLPVAYRKELEELAGEAGLRGAFETALEAPAMRPVGAFAGEYDVPIESGPEVTTEPLPVGASPIGSEEDVLGMALQAADVREVPDRPAATQPARPWSAPTPAAPEGAEADEPTEERAAPARHWTIDREREDEPEEPKPTRRERSKPKRRRRRAAPAPVESARPADVHEDDATYFSPFDPYTKPSDEEEVSDGEETFYGLLDNPSRPSSDEPQARPAPVAEGAEGRAFLSEFDARVLNRPDLRERAGR